MSDERTKVKVSITLDDDVLDKAEECAKEQRSNVSAMINQLLANALGLIRKKPNDHEPH
jgi:metal-responsive CopG/Arc/MetJ family transcriptional regulator